MLRTKKKVLLSVQLEERRQLAEELEEAEREWNLARWRFDYALGHDHVDYAIYSLEAAEKKLDMLLRKAKLSWAQANVFETEVKQA